MGFFKILLLIPFLVACENPADKISRIVQHLYLEVEEDTPLNP